MSNKIKSEETVNQNYIVLFFFSPLNSFWSGDVEKSPSAPSALSASDCGDDVMLKSMTSPRSPPPIGRESLASPPRSPPPIGRESLASPRCRPSIGRESLTSPRRGTSESWGPKSAKRRRKGGLKGTEMRQPSGMSCTQTDECWSLYF